MLSKYFEIKTSTAKFDEDLHSLISELKDKKVILYGAGQGFQELNKKHKLLEKLNIIAIADKKFEKEPCEKFYDRKAITPEDIKNEEFDYILVTNERAKNISMYIECELEIDKNKIKTIFVEEIKDECDNLNYLAKFNFDKTLPKLVKKLKNKKVLLYGAGVFLELIQKYYDISGLNIVGISDRRFEGHKDDEIFLSYKAIAPSEIVELKPDYVLVATKFYINIIEDMYYNTLKDTKIKIKPLMKKTLFTLIKEIWG